MKGLKKFEKEHPAECAYIELLDALGILKPKEKNR